MVTENVASQIISGDCSESNVYLQDSLLNKGGWDRHTGQSSAYSSKHSEGKWMEENQETEEEQEDSVTTQNEDKDVNAKVLQRKNSNVNKRVYDCPVCHKRLKPSPKQPTAQDYTKSTDKEKSTVHQDENMVIENMASQIISSLDLHTGLSSAYFSKPSEDQWMEENLEAEEKQESSVTTQSEDNDVNMTVLQSKNSDGNKRVYDCPVCHKRFGAPSNLKRHGLIHTNQRPFQCSICCRAFRERSHLKVHMKIHNVPVKRKKTSLQSYRDNRVSLNENILQSLKSESAPCITLSSLKRKSRL
uniref:C2H2-type domain-containing protein n=1 Tax=Sinocyclocheilus grahami TaxID=75366 RepID=A0A672L1L5_SINGR